jgi:hypothetical protein
MGTSGFIEKMNNTLNLRFDLDNDIRSFEFNASEETYLILPNTRMRMAVYYNYRFLSLRVAFSPKFLAAGDSQEKGKTSVFKIALDMFPKDFYQNLEYNRVKGYYIDGIEGIIPLLENSNEEFILLPGLSTTSITGQTLYRFNENYSFKALVNQTEVQVRSAGSFVPGLDYGYWSIKNSEGPQDLESFHIMATAGYFQTFVLNHNWYANLGLSTGLGIEWNKLDSRIDDTEITTRNSSAILGLNTQIGLGYNSRRFYSGLTLVGNVRTRENSSIVQFNNVRGYFRVFVGYRFDPPKALVQAMDWLEARNPLKGKGQ